MSTTTTGRTYQVRTLGCKANLYDSQRIEAELQKQGWLPGGESANLCVVNSCTVTDEADRQSRKLAARLSRDNPEAFVVVTGCAAEVDPERLAASKGIHYVVGNQDKPALVGTILARLEKNRAEGVRAADLLTGSVLGTVQGYGEMVSRHPMDREWQSSFVTPPVGLDGDSAQTFKTRAFLKVQEGCNAFCTYCVIPYGRGPSRSSRPREVISQVRELVERGIREVVITGTNIGDYGTDWETTAQHGELFRMILAETSLERLRVSSLDPTEITSDILDLAARESRFCPHFHVSLQSPHSRILRLMKRKYGHEEVRRCLDAIAALPAPLGGSFVGMDVITGFPGETLEEFEWGVEALRSLPWSRLHVFPYSEREGTPATRLPGSVPQHERVRRTRVLNELSLERMKAHYERVPLGSRLDGVVLERSSLGLAGYTSNYLRVEIPTAPAGLRNQKVSAVVDSVSVDRASGEVSFVGRLA